MKAIIILVTFFFCSEAFPSTFDLDKLHYRSLQSTVDQNNPEIDAKYWYDKALKELERRKKLSNQKAKNIIMFMGDGMSVPTVTAGRLFLAQKRNERFSESKPLSFEDFLFCGLSRTYCVDYTVADSACSATAYLGGSKANMGTIGVTGRVALKDASESVKESNRVKSIAYLAQMAGKSTGFVTNARVTHASPAGTYAHIAHRDWEADTNMEEDKINSTMYDDIAEQLILREPGIKFNVIMGGGRKNFLPKTKNDTEGSKGNRKDQVNLIESWKKLKQSTGKSFSYVSNKQELMKLDNNQTYVLGLFADSHMSYAYENNTEEPSLEEMTERAIKILAKTGGDKGFFLFVEGGKIDMAHHTTQAQISLDETVEFSKAIAKAVEMTKEEDTLIVVTSDHAHTLTVNGYPLRKESLFGFAGEATDGMAHTILSYANGPGFAGRKNLTHSETHKVEFEFPKLVPLDSETHGGDDVAVFARGPGAQLFSGSYEQSYIPHAMAQAMGCTLTTIEEVKAVINKFKNYKVPGFDDLYRYGGETSEKQYVADIYDKSAGSSSNLNFSYVIILALVFNVLNICS